MREEKQEGMKVTPAKFTKEQILASRKYRNQPDLIHALLEDDKKYSLQEVDKRIESFMKRKVK